MILSLLIPTDYVNPQDKMNVSHINIFYPMDSARQDVCRVHLQMNSMMNALIALKIVLYAMMIKHA